MCRLLRQIPQQVQWQPHPPGLGRVERVGEELPLLQLHPQRQREQGPARLGLCSRLFPRCHHQWLFGIFSKSQTGPTESAHTHGTILPRTAWPRRFSTAVQRFVLQCYHASVSTAITKYLLVLNTSKFEILTGNGLVALVVNSFEFEPPAATAPSTAAAFEWASYPRRDHRTAQWDILALSSYLISSNVACSIVIITNLYKISSTLLISNLWVES